MGAAVKGMEEALRGGLLLGAKVLAEYLQGVAEENVDPEEGFFSEPAGRQDARDAHEDLVRLARGGDARYDLVMSGDLYAAWYQLRRVVHAIGALTHPLVADDADLDVLDIGCGTGATAWALAIIERARTLCGAPARRVRIVGVDGSPFMTSTAQHLWERLVPEMEDVEVEARFLTSSWRHLDVQAVDELLEEPLLVGGYVLDQSDRDSIDELAGDLGMLAALHGAERMLLFGPRGKREILTGLLSSIAAATGPSGWTSSEGTIARGFVPSAPPETVRTARARLLTAAGVTARDSSDVNWSETSESTFVIARRTGQARLAVGQRSAVVLDSLQERAAAPSERPVLVVGAAGSGKSEVLVRRIVNALDQAARPTGRARSGSPARILVTAFNRYMVDHLVLRVEQELAALPDPLRVRYGWCTSPCGPCKHAPKKEGAVDCTISVGSEFQTASVRFLNWDKVFTRLLDVASAGTVRTPAYIGRSSPADKDALRRAGITDTFLEAEYFPVIYGLRVRTIDEYVDIVRRGRGQERVRRQLRPAIWRAIDPYGAAGGPRTFTRVRYDAWSSGATPDESKRFDVVVIDEAQDLTDADFEIVGRLVSRSGSVVAALDPTQSQQLGASFQKPGSLEVAGRESRRYWDEHGLSRTHRLSISISRSIRPLAEAVRTERGEIPSLEPRKSAVIGARPILMEVNGRDDMSQIATVLRYYEGYFRSDFGETAVTSLLCAGDHIWYSELDAILKEWSEGGGTRISRGAVDRRQKYFNGEWKGLEFDAVVWLTDAVLGRPQQLMDAVPEWVYTVISRPRSLLVIGLTPQTDPGTREAVARFEDDDIRLWDEERVFKVMSEWRRGLTKA